AAEFAHDGLHAGATGADAGADGIDLGGGAGDGDLGAITGLAREGLDLDGAVGDLGDLEVKEAADKLRAGAAEDDLGTARRGIDREQQAADAFAGLGFLAGHLLLAGHGRLGLAQINVEVAAFAPTHGAGHDVADLVLEIVVNAVLFKL